MFPTILKCTKPTIFSTFLVDTRAYVLTKTETHDSSVKAVKNHAFLKSYVNADLHSGFLTAKPLAWLYKCTRELMPVHSLERGPITLGKNTAAESKRMKQ
ncbi:hypothetical protein RF11_03809 [Thelohanellus kitauei]|uniref:Uncharacterized protein n=1 Tax=Thelohanellus kitauei TaxID=669202 RepID=A0A0C2MNT2_THEKT|nr:hypothetical protein RF11_03809 [Thelohanellus kitauei]